MKRVSPRLVAAAWGVARQHVDRLFAPGAAAFLAHLDGWAPLGLGDTALDREPSLTLLDALRAIALAQRAAALPSSMNTTELVCTVPSPDRNLLSTGDVAGSIVDDATRDLLVLGFEFGDTAVRRALLRRAAAGVRITFVGDRRTSSAKHFRRDWPPAISPPKVLENVEPLAENAATLMHAKAIVADRRVALVGSANFTAGGLRSNLEVGVRVTGAVAADIVRTIERLEREGWLVPVHA